MKVHRKYKIFMVYLSFHNHYKWQTPLGKLPRLCQRQMPGSICRWITASQPEQSISVSCVCACGTGGMLEAHIFECSGSPSEGKGTFQNVCTALTLLSNFSIDSRTEMGDRLSEQQPHPSLKVFLTNVVLRLTLLHLSPI